MPMDHPCTPGPAGFTRISDTVRLSAPNTSTPRIGPPAAANAAPLSIAAFTWSASVNNHRSPGAGAWPRAGVGIMSS